MTSVLPLETLGSITKLLAATTHQGNSDKKYKLRNIVPGGDIYDDTAGILLHLNGKFTVGKFRPFLLS